MELGSWSIIQPGTPWALLALIPLVVYIVMVFMGKSNNAGIFTGIVVGALLLGQGLPQLAAQFLTSLGSSTAMIGLIIMTGAGLGLLMNRARITHTLVYWIVKRIGVDTQTKAKLVLVICSIIICGLLGTLGGGNAIIAPILIPVMASLKITPSTTATLFKTAGEVGLILGPLTGVTLITMKVTGLSYATLMIGACIPFAIVWMLGTWFAAKRTQRRTAGKEEYETTDDMRDVAAITVDRRSKINTIIFLVAFVGLIVYGILAKQGTSYALIVMIILSAIVAICGRMKIDDAISTLIKGIASQADMFVLFVTIDVLLTMVSVGGGFDALSQLLGHLSQGSPTAVMLIASVVGGLGIEAAAVAEIQIISDMFAQSAIAAGLPMTMFAIALLAATRLTGSIYPTSNLMGQLGIARAHNTKEVLQACWIAAAVVAVAIIIWSFVGVAILT